MTLKTTTLYAIPLAIIFLALFMNVTMKRSAMNLSIGDGGDMELLERIRKHGNFVEWTPMVLILMALAEAQGAGFWWLHAAGALLVIGRLLHPIGLKANVPTHPLRIAGNMGGILATVIMVIALVRISFGF
ncbi:MAG: MAPEG family protein [Beijerinckiaceae bacterium]